MFGWIHPSHCDYQASSQFPALVSSVFGFLEGVPASSVVFPRFLGNDFGVVVVLLAFFSVAPSEAGATGISLPYLPLMEL